MGLMHLPRHTRRGFIRDGSAYPKIREQSVWTETDLFRPPAEPLSVTVLEESENIDFPPLATRDTGSAFLSWLADEIAGQAQHPSLSSRDVCHRDTARRILASFEATQEFEYSNEARALLSTLRTAVQNEVVDDDIDLSDPYLDDSFADSLDIWEDEQTDYDFSYGVTSTGPVEEELDAPLHVEYAQALRMRARPQPHVEVSPDGGREETFAAGTRIVKDVLGRVIEVQSAYGDCLFMHYGPFGSLESFARTDCTGHPHSLGRLEKDGAVVRDHEGRVKATGQSMTVDSWGALYLHSSHGQFFSINLMQGVHTERRRLSPAFEPPSYITAIFTHDGFRMATMYSGVDAVSKCTASGASRPTLSYRFYGRDGTQIDFASEDDLRQMRPCRVLPAGTRQAIPAQMRRRQAGTAWQSVKEYLLQVS